MGLIRFDLDGFVVAICRSPARLNDPDCPPQIGGPPFEKKDDE